MVHVSAWGVPICAACAARPSVSALRLLGIHKRGLTRIALIDRREILVLYVHLLCGFRLPFAMCAVRNPFWLIVLNAAARMVEAVFKRSYYCVIRLPLFHISWQLYIRRNREHRTRFSLHVLTVSATYEGGFAASTRSKPAASIT